MNRKIYNISNILGILFVGFGFGLLNVGTGFIAAGLMLVGVNIYNIQFLKD